MGVCVNRLSQPCDVFRDSNEALIGTPNGRDRGGGTEDVDSDSLFTLVF